MAVFIDSNIFMYAAGADHPNKKPSVKFLESIATDPNGQESFVSNCEVLQEILYRYTVIKRPDLAHQIFTLCLSLPVTYLPVHVEELIEAQKIRKKYPDLSVRDSVHAATMKNMGITRIISFDKDFSKLPFIERIEPTLN